MKYLNFYQDNYLYARRKETSRYDCQKATDAKLDTVPRKIDCSSCERYQAFQIRLNEEVENKRQGAGAEI